MISLRLSDEEFRGLQALSECKGTRSVSDLIRLAISRVNHTQNGHPADHSLDHRFALVTRRLDEIENTLRQMTQAQGATASRD